MENELLLDKIKNIIGKETIGRYDLIPIFKDSFLFIEIIELLAKPYINKIDYVVAPESLGWILGVGISLKLKCGFIPLRKENKLPYQKGKIIQKEYKDYTAEIKKLEITKGIMPEKSKILIVDEWVETGETMKASIKIIEDMNCEIIGLATIGIDENENTIEWINNKYITFVGKNI